MGSCSTVNSSGNSSECKISPDKLCSVLVNSSLTFPGRTAIYFLSKSGPANCWSLISCISSVSSPSTFKIPLAKVRGQQYRYRPFSKVTISDSVQYKGVTSCSLLWSTGGGAQTGRSCGSSISLFREKVTSTRSSKSILNSRSNIGQKDTSDVSAKSLNSSVIMLQWGQ